MTAPHCTGCAQTLSADRKGTLCRWCEELLVRATEPEPLCSLCGLEDGACICAHLPKRATEPEPEERDMDPDPDGGMLDAK